MVVMKLDVKLSSANRSSRQLLPTPAGAGRRREGWSFSSQEAWQRPARPQRPPPPSPHTPDAYEQEFDKVVIVLAFGHIFDGDSDGLRAALLAGALA